MNPKKKAPTLRPLLLFIALISAITGIWQYLSTPPSSDSLFNPEKPTISVEGQVNIFSTVRGLRRIQIISTSGKKYYIDCLTNIAFCEQSPPKNKANISSVLANIHRDFYWPVSAEFRPGPTLTQEQSKYLYDLYREREASLYKLWLNIAIAFTLLAIWLGKTSIF